MIPGASVYKLGRQIHNDLSPSEWLTPDEISRRFQHIEHERIEAAKLREQVDVEADNLLAFLLEGQHDTSKLIKEVVGSMILPDYIESAKSHLVNSGVSFSKGQLNKISAGIERSRNLAQALNDALTRYISNQDNPQGVLDLQSKMTRMAERFNHEVKNTAQLVIYKEPVRLSSRYH